MSPGSHCHGDQSPCACTGPLVTEGPSHRMRSTATHDWRCQSTTVLVCIQYYSPERTLWNPVEVQLGEKNHFTRIDGSEIKKGPNMRIYRGNHVKIHSKYSMWAILLAGHCNKLNFNNRMYHQGLTQWFQWCNKAHVASQNNSLDSELVPLLPHRHVISEGEQSKDKNEKPQRSIGRFKMFQLRQKRMKRMSIHSLISVIYPAHIPIMMF